MKRPQLSTYNLYAAKTGLSKLVDEAAAGKEFVIAKNGKPMAKLIPFEPKRKTGKKKYRDWGENLLGVTYIAPDFDEPVWTDAELKKFGF